MKISYPVKFGIAAIPVSFFCAYMASSFYSNPPISSADCAAWLGAIGTVGAIIGAILIASSQERYRQRESMGAARISAAGMLMRAASLHTEALYSSQWFIKFGQDDGDLATFINFKDSLSALPMWSHEELVRLAPIPNQCAFNLAAAQDRLFAAVNLIKVAVARPGFTSDRSGRMASALFVGQLLDEAREFLHLAFSEMQAQTFERRPLRPSGPP